MLAVVGRGLVVGPLGCGGQPGLEALELLLVGGQRGLGRGLRLREPVGLGQGGPGHLPELAELLGDRGHAGVGLVEAGEGRLGPARGVRLPGARRGEVEAEPVELMGHGLEGGHGLVVGRLHLEQARGTGRAAVDDALREDVALRGDERQARVVRRELRRLPEVGHQRPSLEQVVDDGLQHGLAVDEVEERAAGVAHVRTSRAGGLGVGHDQRCAAGVLVLEQDDGLHGRVHAGHDDGVGDVAESRRDGGLRA